MLCRLDVLTSAAVFNIACHTGYIYPPVTGENGGTSAPG